MTSRRIAMHFGEPRDSTDERRSRRSKAEYAAGLPEVPLSGAIIVN
jgi:hypothetical protein